MHAIRNASAFAPRPMPIRSAIGYASRSNRPLNTTLKSPLGLDECVARVERTSDPESFLDAGGSRPVIAKVRGASLRLRKRRPYGHSFAPMLYCHLEADGNGTRIQCKPRVMLLPKLFAAVWLGFVGFFLFAFLVATIGAAVAEGSISPGVSESLVPLGALAVMFAFGVGLVWSGHRIGKREMPQLQAYLVETLSAEPVGGYANVEPVAAASADDEPQTFPRTVYLACVAGMLLGLGAHVLMLFGIDIPSVVAFLFVAALLSFVFVLLTISRRAEAVGLLRFEDVQEALLSRFPRWFPLASRIFGLYFAALFAWPLLGGGDEAISLFLSVAPAWFFGGTALILRSWDEITREGVEA